MASGTITGRTGNADVSAKIEWSYTQNVTANKTTVTATVYIRRLDDGTWTSYGTTNITLSIAGTSKTESKYFSVGHHGTSDWFQMITNTVDVPHNADGTHANITISCTSSGSGTTVEPIACSGTISLPTIARASQPSAGNGTFGGAITINTNRASSSFTHTLTMSMGSHSETKTGVGASLSWTIPASWADTIPTATSNTLSISCITYSGSTNIGTKTTSCTISIPSSWVPSVSITKTLSNAGTNSTVLVNVTTVNLSASASASTGTSISSYSWSGSVSGTGSSKTHSPTSAGNYSYTVTATDRRGRTSTATVSVTAISGVSTFTCASSVNFGSALSVSIARAKPSFTHNVRYYISSSYYNDVSDGGSASASYTIPTSWAASVPNGSSINMTVTVTTYNGSSSLGSTSKTVSVVVPSSWVPAFTLGVEGVSIFNGQWLKGVSKVKVNVTSVSASTGSSIKSYTISGPNLSASSNTSATSYSATSDILGTVGTNTYTVKVTDNRGRVTQQSIGCTVIDYSPPTIKITVGRYDSGGVSDNFGAFGRVIATGSYSAVNGNKWTLILNQKKKTVSSYSRLNTYNDQTGTVSATSSLFAADVDSAYDCQAIITDSVGKTATARVALSTGKALMDMFKDKVIGFFSTASEALRNTFGNPSSLLFYNAEKTYLNGNVFVPANGAWDGLTSGWQEINRTPYIWIEDTRDTNRTPEWYMSIHSHSAIAEFKLKSSIGLSGSGYCTLFTIVPWSDQSGGKPYQYAFFADGPIYCRTSASNTAWTSWGGYTDPYGGGAWVSGRDKAGLKKAISNDGYFYPFVSQKTKNGSWDLGALGNDNDLCFSYVSDSDYSSGTNSHTSIYFTNAGNIINSNGATFRHSSNSLTHYVYSTSSKSIASGTVTDVYSYSLPSAGTYLVVCDARWNVSLDSVYILYLDLIHPSSGTELDRYIRANMKDGGGASISMLCGAGVAGQTIKFKAYQGTGAARTIQYRWSSIRIKDTL